MTGLTQEDFDWIRRMLAGRTPTEIERMKAVVQQYCDDLDRSRDADHLNPELPESAADDLLDVVDGLSETRAFVYALDMALSDLPADEENALRSMSDLIMQRIVKIRAAAEALRTGGREPACA